MLSPRPDGPRGPGALRWVVSEFAPTQLARWAERSRRDPRVIDSAIALALVVLMQVMLAQQHVGVAPRLPMLVVLVAAFRRTHPVPVTLCIAAAVALQGLSTTPPSNFGEYLAVMLASYTVASECGLWLALTCGLALAAGIVAHDIRSPEYGSPSGMASDLMIPVIIWGVGRAVRYQRGTTQRSQRRVNELEQRRLELARTAVATERAYLARELHDVVSHSVSVVVIQAQGAKAALGSQAPDVQLALDRIEDAGCTLSPRCAISLASCVTRTKHWRGFRSRGARSFVRWSRGCVQRVCPPSSPRSGSGRRLTPALSSRLTASCRRHDERAQTRRRRKCGGHAAIRAGLDRHHGHRHRSGRSGSTPFRWRSRTGLHERVTVYGGTLDAGPLPGGGFGVHARLPIEPGEASDVRVGTT
jgi:hypothetical protein